MEQDVNKEIESLIINTSLDLVDTHLYTVVKELMKKKIHIKDSFLVCNKVQASAMAKIAKELITIGALKQDDLDDILLIFNHDVRDGIKEMMSDDFQQKIMGPDVPGLKIIR